MSNSGGAKYVWELWGERVISLKEIKKGFMEMAEEGTQRKM